MDADPEEYVSVPHVQGGLITLRSAVQKVMALSPIDQGLAEIFRQDTQPAILTINEIKRLAERPEFQS